MVAPSVTMLFSGNLELHLLLFPAYEIADENEVHLNS